jgi:hypothetical protein
MTAEELMRCVGSLEQAAELVEAIDDGGVQRRRGLDLAGWRYELVPWGVRFVRRERDGGESEVFVLAVLKDRTVGGVRVVLSMNDRPASAARPV